ncbi:unnamed protein product, partial [Trichogramma brassicae]
KQFLRKNSDKKLEPLKKAPSTGLGYLRNSGCPGQSKSKRSERVGTQNRHRTAAQGRHCTVVRQFLLARMSRRRIYLGSVRRLEILKHTYDVHNLVAETQLKLFGFYNTRLYINVLKSLYQPRLERYYGNFLDPIVLFYTVKTGKQIFFRVTFRKFLNLRVSKDFMTRIENFEEKSSYTFLSLTWYMRSPGKIVFQPPVDLRRQVSFASQRRVLCIACLLLRSTHIVYYLQYVLEMLETYGQLPGRSSVFESLTSILFSVMAQDREMNSRCWSSNSSSSAGGGGGGCDGSVSSPPYPSCRVSNSDGGRIAVGSRSFALTAQLQGGRQNSISVQQRVKRALPILLTISDPYF